MTSHPPAALALADQMQAAVMDRAQQVVTAGLHNEGLPTPDEDEQLFIDMGIAAGMALTMQVLIEMGALKTATS